MCEVTVYAKKYEDYKKSKELQRNSLFRSFLAGINVEKLLFTTFFLFFSLLVITQTMLTISGSREGLSANSAIEGVPLGKEEFLYKEGEITLELLSEYKTYGDKIKVLLNGEEIGNFTYRLLTLKVKDGDIIEIDSTSVIDRIYITHRKASLNVINVDLGKKYAFDAEVKKIKKVKIQ